MAISASRICLALLSLPLSAQNPNQWRTPWGDPDLQGSWSNASKATRMYSSPDRLLPVKAKA